MDTDARRRKNRLALRLSASFIILTTAAMLTAQGSKYVKPKSGWLYVATSDYKAQAGQVLVVDPEAGRVVEGLTSGYQPDIAVSPDGARLYLSYNNSMRPDGALEVIDTTTGTRIAQVGDADPWPSNGQAYSSHLALSHDGHWLFHYKVHSGMQEGKFYVQTFDTDQNQLLPDTAAVRTCGSATLLPAFEREKLYVTCSATEDVRVLTLNERGGLTDAKPVTLKVPGGDQFTQEMVSAFLAPGGQVLTVIKGDGRFVKADTASDKAFHKDAIDGAARSVPNPFTKLSPRARRPVPPRPEQDWLTKRQIQQQNTVLAPDGSKLYLITAAGENTHAVRDQVVVLDSETLARVQTIRLSRPCVSLTISKDGRRLYAVDTINATVLVIDAASGKELKSISGIGPRPVFAVVAP